MEHPIKPRIFIGSASESLAIARQLEVRLQKKGEVILWDSTIATIGIPYLDVLINIVDTVDFAIFIFSDDDKVTSRGIDFDAPSANIIFELGLFMSKLGMHRTYIVNSIDNLKMPTDLAGVTYGLFKKDRSDNNLAHAVSPVCTLIEEQVANHGIRNERISFLNTQKKSIKIEEDIAKSYQEIFKKIGIQQLDYSIQSGYSIKDCLDDVNNSLCFLGVSGDRWVQEIDSFNNLIKRVLLKKQLNQIRFLLLNPDCVDANNFIEGKDCSNEEFNSYLNTTIEFLTKTNAKYGLDIQLRLYSRMPNLRITIIDQGVVVLGKYSLLSNDNHDSPQIIFKSSSNWAFTHNFISYFEQLWSESIIINLK